MLGDRRTLRLVCQILLAANPTHLSALENLAYASMKDDDPEGAAKLYARIEAQQSRPPIKVYRSALMDPVRAASQEPYIHTFHDVIVETTQCAVLEADRIYVREIGGMNFANHPYVDGRATPDFGFFAVSCPSPRIVIKNPFVLIGTDGGSNYSHWVSRNLLKLGLLEKAGIYSSLPLLVNRDLCDYQIQYLDLLGIDLNQLLPVQKGLAIRCDEVIVPTLLRNHPQMHIGIDWLRARLERFIEPEEKACDLLYVSRRDSTRRVLLNEQEVEDALSKYGFNTITLSGMPVAEQIRRFSRARVIVAPHGSALANLIFAPSRAVVVEITNTKIHHMNDFRFISTQRGQRHEDVVSNWFSTHQTIGQYQQQLLDYCVDTAEVVETVERLAHDVL
jgi:hypothetical protein